MRLLHTTSLQFEEFFDTNCPRYVILSHRWQEKEAGFRDLEIGKEQGWPGFVKIEKSCVLAKARGFDWIWIDTCCIDKKSSAELSEAINSMFRWYAEAEECYAYLSDIEFLADLAQSTWFTRGWTLQELLAPSNVIFLNCEWKIMGTKKDLLAEISDATHIAVHYLSNMHKASVATKMSWVSRRKTSRVEDMAYCLLGLFDVNMPLLYGEGRKAFLRLELEIVKKSDDESIFAWTSTSAKEHSGLLALWPDSFAHSADIRVPDSGVLSRSYEQKIIQRQPYSMTNRGLEFPTPEGTLPKIILNCWKVDKRRRSAIVITLRRYGTIWQRVECGALGARLLEVGSLRQSLEKKIRTIWIQQEGL